MNIVARQPKRLLKYPSRVHFYSEPPEEEVRIEEFEQFALDRLQVLKALETARIRNKRDHELESYIKPIEKKCLPLSRTAEPTTVLDEERRKDHISHFILRLAYCRTEDLRRWFLSQECALFRYTSRAGMSLAREEEEGWRFVGPRYRLEAEPAKEKEEFIARNDLGYQAMPPEEKRLYSEQLRTASSHLANALEKEFYKVPFEHALELVMQRKVFLHQGFAHVPSSDLLSLMVGEFRARLSRALVATAKALPRMEEDERLMPMLNSIGRQYVGPDYTGKQSATAGQVNAENIDHLVTSFPLCMQHLHRRLREDGHLRYGGRQQYGLFLKGVGMTMDEALVFWKRAFLKKVPEDKFNREYAYNVRHNYGQEGKRANYSPYNCVKIITSNQPSTGDHHGCPFKHFSSDNLRAVLHSASVPDKTIAEICDLVRNQHYQIACTRYYEAVHHVEEQTDTVSHPNEYADRALKLRRGDAEMKPEPRLDAL